MADEKLIAQGLEGLEGLIGLVLEEALDQAVAQARASQDAAAHERLSVNVQSRPRTRRMCRGPFDV